MIKDLFKEEDIHIRLLKESSPTIVGTTYGFEFSNSMFFPKESRTIQIPDTNVSVLDFAIDSFNSLWKDLRFYSSVQRIPKSSKYHFSKLKPVIGFVNPIDVYEGYISLILKSINATKVFLTLNDYTREALKTLLDFSQSVTLSDFLKSNIVSVYNTGLAISLIDTKTNLETENEYIIDSYFEVFQNLCLLHNFQIDTRLPWTIVLKVNDNTMNETDAYVNAYTVELTTLLQVITMNWKLYVQNALGEDDKKKIDLKDNYIDSNFVLNYYLQLKAKQQGIVLSKQDTLRMKIYFHANTIHNGLSNSIAKLSNLGKIDESVCENWKRLLSQGRDASLNPALF